MTAQRKNLKNSQKPPAGHEYNGMKAILPSRVEIAPTTHVGGFHGTKHFDPARVFVQGIPQKGNDRRLLEHVNGNELSAFRGTNSCVLFTPEGPGAALWAGDGGWVYEICSVPTWDTEQELQGRVQSNGGYGGCPTLGELESAIPAEVKPYRIIAAAAVVTHRGTRLKVLEWQPNPQY